MNEKGLCVSLSFGGGSISDVAGIGAGIFERIILEQAASVEEAIEIFKEAEYVSPNILLLSDASGSSAVIEMDGDTHRIRRGEEAMMCFNHYSHPEMKPEQEVKNPTTLWREAQARKLWNSLSSKDDIIRFLASDFPEGLYEPYYSEGLGTLWSVVFEPGTLDVSVSIGKYPENKRLNFSFSEQEKEFSLPESISAEFKNVDIAARLSDYKA